jgi:shikimate dehydrogenase
MTARAYAEVIGDPIDHSLSPAIHGFWLETLGIPADYRRHRVARGGLQSYLAERRGDPQWRGCNVTMPLKLDAIALADEVSDRAIGTGAANILVPRDGRLLAGNSDVGAVEAAIQILAESGAPTGLVTLLGSGGAARAALMALRLLGISAVRIQSRNLAEAYKLAVQFRLSEEPRPFDSPVTGDGLINATPLGMKNMPPLDLDLGRIAANGWVIDLVTSPAPTDLLRRAAARGLQTVDGIAVLVEQADDSFRLLFGADPPREADAQLFARLRP